MKVIVQFSGGKDSHASLIWAVNKYGAKNVIAQFSNTEWDNKIVYPFIKEVTDKLKVKLVVLTSKKWKSFENMVLLKKQFPSAINRFCTPILKVEPFVDWLLDDFRDNAIIIQGIRAQESSKRSKMPIECDFFKYYSEPYTINNRGHKVYYYYRRQEVLAYKKKFDSSRFLPVFKWSAQEVIDYILANGHKPNPLYYQGSSRVGCYPCVLSTHRSLYEVLKRDPLLLDYLEDLEKRATAFIFPSSYVPLDYRKHFVTNKKGEIVPIASIRDIWNYLDRFSGQLDLFGTSEIHSCSSVFHLCE